jgi:hypothetical protein
MSGVAKVLRYTAFTLMALFGLLGSMFVIGEVFTDPGGWTAVWVTALWLVPLVVLSVLAAGNPEAVTPVFVWVTAALVVFTLADSAFGVVPRDDLGPVAAISVFALGVSLAFLGLHRARLAGLLMVVAALGHEPLHPPRRRLHPVPLATHTSAPPGRHTSRSPESDRDV